MDLHTLTLTTDTFDSNTGYAKKLKSDTLSYKQMDTLHSDKVDTDCARTVLLSPGQGRRAEEKSVCRT